MRLLHTLYAKLAAVLVLLFAAMGLVYVLVSTSATEHYLQTVSQRFNRDLARNLVADRNLVHQGRIDEQALKETFHEYMVINPSIEIYLLDRQGAILSYSADPAKVKRKRVSLGPIRAYLSGEAELPLLGDDPRSHDRRKTFSVTPVPSAEKPEGYLYVVLRGEEFDAVEKVARESFFLQLSAWAAAASLAVGLLAGLVGFHILTRRLRRLARVMERFDQSGFATHLPYSGAERRSADEVDQLGETFDRMAQRIIGQFKELQRKDSLRREMVAHVSHDLRTPLASLRGYLESLKLKETELSEQERAEYVDIALRHSERLTRLVAELFELAKLDANETRPHCEPFSAAELVQDVAQKFHLSASDRGIRIVAAPALGLPFVCADIGLTERVLDNLIENALRCTGRGGRVELSLERSGERIAVHVADTGRGIPKPEQADVFKPFSRVASQGAEGDHAGLGLAIAKRIVELQGGCIWLTSRAGEGSVFSFTLPMAPGLT